jgi:hypothetical protein
MRSVTRAYIALCLALLTGSVALTQQSAEWRPSIADDNKAATLDDTMKFVVGITNDPILSRLYFQADQQNSGKFKETYLTASTGKCLFEWNYLGITMDTRHIQVITRWRIVADLSKVDPLSLRVISAVKGSSNSGFLVAMSGTSGAEFAEGELYLRNSGERLPSDIWAFISQEKSASCKSGDKKCNPEKNKASDAWLFIADQEAAHRTARALMHAALLCGGKKAVSPF